MLQLGGSLGCPNLKWTNWRGLRTVHFAPSLDKPEQLQLRLYRLRLAWKATEPSVACCVQWHAKSQNECLQIILEESHWREVPDTGCIDRAGENIAADYR